MKNKKIDNIATASMLPIVSTACSLAVRGYIPHILSPEQEEAVQIMLIVFGFPIYYRIGLSLHKG